MCLGSFSSVTKGICGNLVKSKGPDEGGQGLDIGLEVSLQSSRGFSAGELRVILEHTALNRKIIQEVSHENGDCCWVSPIEPSVSHVY